MRTESGNIPKSANIGSGKSAAKTSTDGKSAADDCGWFSQAARLLYAHKPGTVLHLVTGLGDERLCQRYASGEVRPPAYFLRRLLWSDHGERWLNAVMAGCTQAWWLEIQRARKLAAAVRAAEAR